MLGAIKLGVVVIPASLLLTPDDLADRMKRGEVRGVVAAAEVTERFGGRPGGEIRICVGGEPAGWHPLTAAGTPAETFTPRGGAPADDPLLLYFTSGTTSRPKLVEHTHASYPVGHLSTMYWIGLRPGDIHLNISSPGWAKHAWSNFFAPWNAEATVLVFNYARFDADQLLEVLSRCGVTTLCAPPTVWRMLIQADLAAYEVSLALRNPRRYRLMFSMEQDASVDRARLASHPLKQVLEAWSEAVDRYRVPTSPGSRSANEQGAIPLWTGLHGQLALWHAMPAAVDETRLAELERALLEAVFPREGP
jgi:acyl-CoA synthetase (AMP-forming)/AMP-acid ligase II